MFILVQDSYQQDTDKDTEDEEEEEEEGVRILKTTKKRHKTSNKASTSFSNGHRGEQPDKQLNNTMGKSDATKLKNTREELKKATKELNALKAQMASNKTSGGSNDNDDHSSSDGEGSNGRNLRSNDKRKSPPSAARAHQDSGNVITVTLKPTKRGKGRGRNNKKKGKKGTMTMEGLIHEAVKDTTWRKNKVCKGPKSGKRLAEMILDSLDIDQFRGDDPETEAARQEWIEEYQATCTTKLNYVRGYVQGRLKDACHRYRVDHNGHLPPIEWFEKCLMRTIDWNNEDERKFFCWYWDEFLPRAAGNDNDWDDAKRRYATISTAAPPGFPDELYMTSSTEAMGVTLVKSCYQRWDRMYYWWTKHSGRIQQVLLKNHKGEIEHAERVGLFCCFLPFILFVLPKIVSVCSQRYPFSSLFRCTSAMALS